MQDCSWTEKKKKEKSRDCSVRSEKLQVFSCILEQNFHCGKLLVEAICLLSAKIIFVGVHQQYFSPYFFLS